MPPYFYRVPLAVPYWNDATYRGILRSILSAGVIHGPDVGKLRSLVIQTLRVEEAVLCGSGSFALEFALRACRVRQGEEVVLPTFCCTALVAPILAVGALPVFADVSAELNLTAETVAPFLTERTKAIIVPHLFGNPANINAIIDLARGRNICVIDDAAQALGATIDGQALGSFGDVGILSFGQEKVCFGLGGGVVVSRNKNLLNGAVPVNGSPGSLSTAVRSLLSTLVWRRWRRWTLPVRRAFSRKSASPELPPRPYRKEKMANLNAAVASSLMQTLPGNIAARRERVNAYQDLLGTEQRLTLIPHRAGSACLTQVIRVLPSRRGADPSTSLIEALCRAGYEAQGSYVPIHLLPSYEPWVRERLPYAERVWADLIELPCEPDVSLDEVERIAVIVKKVITSWPATRSRHVALTRPA
ncbi:MAG: DegT/DnrJ/EryC1/StrS family aminotransferase [Candidatus Binatia bacterium]